MLTMLSAAGVRAHMNRCMRVPGADHGSTVAAAVAAAVALAFCQHAHTSQLSSPVTEMVSRRTSAAEPHCITAAAGRHEDVAKQCNNRVPRGQECACGGMYVFFFTAATMAAPCNSIQGQAIVTMSWVLVHAVPCTSQEAE
jgi:hypothetical protein